MLAQEMSAEQYLRTYLRLLWRRKWIIALSTLIVGGVAFGVATARTPMYNASAEVLLRARASENLFDPNSGSYVDPFRDAATQIRVITGQPVRELVQEKLGAAPAVSAENVTGTDLVKITAVSADPATAQRVANAYAVAYIEYRKTSDVDDLASASKTIQAKITDLQAQIDGYDRQITESTPQQRPAIEATVKSERDGLIAQLVGLKQTFDRIQLTTSLNRGGAQVVTQAQLPGAPFEPQPLRSGASGLAVGLILGLSMAFLLDLLDDSAKTKEEVERVTGGIRVIGSIPTVSSWKDKRSTVVVTRDEPGSNIGEAYRTLRTSIQFMSLDRPLRLIQVTSPQASEGKSTTLANLAVVLARAGQRVVVVDCDLRRPRIHKFFDVPNDIGLTSVLLGDASLSAALQPVRDEPNLSVLASGQEPPDPSEVLSGMRVVEVLTALQGLADVVLIDSPPVLPVADATIISTRVDATLLVVSAGTSSRKQIHRAVDILGQVEAPIIGVVLNRAKADPSYGGYGYGYRYESGYGYRARRPEDARK